MSVDLYLWRQPRLARGWTTVQLIGRMRLVARRDGVVLPKTWQLMRLLFLWENHRLPVPSYYASLLTEVFDRPPARTYHRRWVA